MFHIKTKKNKSRYARRGDDLHTSITVTLAEALVGFKRTLTHLDGHTVVLETDQPTPPGSVMVVGGEGMPIHHSDQFGGGAVPTLWGRNNKVFGAMHVKVRTKDGGINIY